MNDNFHRQLHADSGQLEEEIEIGLNGISEISPRANSEFAGNLAYFWMKGAELAEEIKCFNGALQAGNSAEINDHLLDIHSVMLDLQDKLTENGNQIVEFINKISPVEILYDSPEIEAVILKFSGKVNLNIASKLEWYFSQKKLMTKRINISSCVMVGPSMQISVKMIPRGTTGTYNISETGLVSECP